LLANAGKIDGNVYPFGYILMAGTDKEWRQCTPADSLTAVREAMTAVQAGTLSDTELQIRMLERLTESQKQIMYAELIKDSNLYDVMTRTLDAASLEQVSLQSAGSIMVHILDSNDNKALAGRAAISTAVDLGGYAMMNMSNFSTGEGFSSALVGVIFCAIDTYRWLKKDITSTELGIKYAEHSAGCAAAYGGAMTGFGLGTMVGGPVLGLLCMFLGGFASDYLARKAVRKTANSILKHMAGGELKAYAKVEKAAAACLGVDLAAHSRGEAHKRFRTKLLLVHPDKFQNATPEIKTQKQGESIELISSWQIVRGYYEKHPELCGDTELHETFIDLMLVKVRDTVDDTWRVVKSHFADVEFLVQDPELEMLEPYSMYV
jgi:hypothetical protein